MPIKLVINQAGLSAGRVNQSRSDGLASGTVSFKHTGVGTAVFELLWVPENDTVAASSFAQANNECTFNIDAKGTYRVRVTLTTGSTVETLIRLFAVRMPQSNLRKLALNERADPTADLMHNGRSVIDASEFNESSTSGPFSQGNYGGWYSAVSELIRKVESLAT